MQIVRFVTNLSQHFTFEKSIVIGSAYTPGQSTDYNAVLSSIYNRCIQKLLISQILIMFTMQIREANPEC
jgi:uridylate kinase